MLNGDSNSHRLLTALRVLCSGWPRLTGRDPLPSCLEGRWSPSGGLRSPPPPPWASTCVPPEADKVDRHSGGLDLSTPHSLKPPERETQGLQAGPATISGELGGGSGYFGLAERLLASLNPRHGLRGHEPADEATLAGSSDSPTQVLLALQGCQPLSGWY